MLEALLTGLDSIFELQVLLFLGLGIFIGIWLGAVPGLGGIIGMLLLLPFTFDMEPLSAIALLLGLFAVTTTSDTIASVMLGIPGTAASQATILDGYPLAKRGEAPRAFGAAFAVSAYGGVFGAIALAISLPIVQPLILAFGSPEIFALALLGLAMVGALSGGSMIKGLAAAAMGLLLSTVGAAQTVAEERYSLGLEYLVDDLPLIPVVLGIFAIPELMELATRNISIARETRNQDADSSIGDGVRDAIRHGWLATRCAAIGTYVGMLPGLGAAIVDWVAYGHAVQSARDKSRFGEGDIRGVIAPEAANNATKGGALIPAVAFAIPGSLGTAILLSALILQDIRPGPDMLTTELHITFSMVWMLVIANVVAAGLLMMWSRQVARLAFVPGHFLVPGVIVFVFMGSWLGGLSSIEAWVTCFVFGVVGYLMKAGGWARPPLILGLILGTIVENRFLLSMKTYDGIGWLANPIVLIVLALGILTIVLSARSTIRSNARTDTPRAGEGRARNPAMSFPVSLSVLRGVRGGGVDRGRLGGGSRPVSAGHGGARRPPRGGGPDQGLEVADRRTCLGRRRNAGGGAGAVGVVPDVAGGDDPGHPCPRDEDRAADIRFLVPADLGPDAASGLRRLRPRRVGSAGRLLRSHHKADVPRFGRARAVRVRPSDWLPEWLIL